MDKLKAKKIAESPMKTRIHRNSETDVMQRILPHLQPGTREYDDAYSKISDAIDDECDRLCLRLEAIQLEALESESHKTAAKPSGVRKAEGESYDTMVRSLKVERKHDLVQPRRASSNSNNKANQMRSVGAHLTDKQTKRWTRADTIKAKNHTLQHDSLPQDDTWVAWHGGGGVKHHTLKCHKLLMEVGSKEARESFHSGVVVMTKGVAESMGLEEASIRCCGGRFKK